MVNIVFFNNLNFKYQFLGFFTGLKKSQNFAWIRVKIHTFLNSQIFTLFHEIFYFIGMDGKQH
jgi:hypothetical protein